MVSIGSCRLRLCHRAAPGTRNREIKQKPRTHLRRDSEANLIQPRWSLREDMSMWQSSRVKSRASRVRIGVNNVKLVLSTRNQRVSRTWWSKIPLPFKLRKHYVWSYDQLMLKLRNVFEKYAQSKNCNGKCVLRICDDQKARFGYLWYCLKHSCGGATLLRQANELSFSVFAYEDIKIFSNNIW